MVNRWIATKHQDKSTSCPEPAKDHEGSESKAPSGLNTILLGFALSVRWLQPRTFGIYPLTHFLPVKLIRMGNVAISPMNVGLKTGTKYVYGILAVGAQPFSEPYLKGEKLENGR